MENLRQPSSPWGGAVFGEGYNGSCAILVQDDVLEIVPREKIKGARRILVVDKGKAAIEGNAHDIGGYPLGKPPDEIGIVRQPRQLLRPHLTVGVYIDPYEAVDIDSVVYGRGPQDGCVAPVEGCLGPGRYGEQEGSLPR